MTRKLVKIHTWLALIAFIPLLVICLTGSILVFKHEIDSLLMPNKVRVEAAESGRLTLDHLISNVHGELPNFEPVGWVLFQDTERADLVYVVEHGTSDWQYILLNQYSGELLSPPVTTTHHLTDWLLNLHYELLLDHPGLLISSVFSIILCLLGVSGVVIYRHFWKHFFTLRWDKRLTVFFNDLHKMTGIIATPVLLILGVTGAYWNIRHFIHEEIEHAGEVPYKVTGRLYNDELSLQALHDQANQHVDQFKPTYFLLPYEPKVDITFWGEVPSINFLASEYSSTVTFDAQSGEFKSATDIRTAGLWPKVEDSFRELHYGTFAGLTTRILWCIIGLTPLLLSITGIYVWYQRKQKKRNAKRKRAAKTRERV